MTPETPRSAAPELPTAPASPQVGPEPTPTTNGPLAANLGDRAGVTLTEAEKATLVCECSVGICPMHNEASDGYIEHTVDDLFAAVESLIAARVDAALGEVEQRIHREALAADCDYIEAHGAHVRRNPFAPQHYREIADLVRDYREDHR